MRIRYTFYTESDDFSYYQSVDESREWLRVRGMVRSIVTPLGGTDEPGRELDELEPPDIARWVVAGSMGIVSRKAEEGGYISFTSDRGDWVSIYATRIQAIGGEVVDEEATDDEQDDASWSRWTDESLRLVNPLARS